MTYRASQPFTCASCDGGIIGEPVFHVGLPFCCAGCAAGGPCQCTYDQPDEELGGGPVVARASRPVVVRASQPEGDYAPACDDLDSVLAGEAPSLAGEAPSLAGVAH